LGEVMVVAGYMKKRPWWFWVDDEDFSGGVRELRRDKGLG